MKKNSKENYSLPLGESDFRRMTMLGEIYMPYCEDFLFENGLQPGLTIADVGCGPGNVTLWLAEQVGKKGKIIGIDNSEEQLTILNKKISEKKIDNVSTYQCDIYEVDKINEKFDIIFCRFLFIHLLKPLVAIQKLSKLLKPGGRLIIMELDNSTWSSYPSNEALQQDRDLLCKIGVEKGADFCIGPKLFSYFFQANLHTVNIKIAQPVLFGQNRDYLLLKCKGWANAYLEFGLISNTDLQDLINRLYDLVNDENYLIEGAKMYLASGRN